MIMSVLLLLLLVRGQCVLQEDRENVVSTQLEGSWGLNMDLSLILSPGSAGYFEVQEMK